MKHTHRKLIACGLALALLLSACTAAAGTFSFRSGVTWDTTIDQMLASEGLADGAYNRQDYNGYTFFYLKSQNVYYVFRGDQPVQAYTVQSAGAYDGELERMTALYGASADVSADTVSALLNALIPASAAPADLSGLTAWRLDDGTLAALFIIGGESCTAFFHEQRILNGM